MLDMIKNWLNATANTALGRFIPFLLILLVGLIVIRIVATILNKALSKSKLEKAAHSLIKSLVKTVLYVLLALTAASSLGVDVTGIVALASVITLAISLSLQNSLSNLIGGFTLLCTHPFKSGDYVEIAGKSGTVLEIGIAYTKLTTPDNKMVQIPNASVVANDITNYTCTGTRRVDVTVNASYDMPVDMVLDALREAGQLEGILPEEGVYAKVTEYGQYAIGYVVRVWCPTEIYWDIHNDLTMNVKRVFEAKGIKMTYPHLNVHLDK